MKRTIYGAVAVLLLCGTSFALGTVTENDIHRFNKSVDNRFFAPRPGMMFEVTEDTATPLCEFSNAAASVARDAPSHKRYTNNLGRNVPVAWAMNRIIPEWDANPQVHLNWKGIAEGLEIGFRAELDADCERRAQEAYRRDSVVCVVENVYRMIESDDVIAVRFKHHAFTLGGVSDVPVCPLKSPEDPLWNVRRNLISVAVLPH